ncbi:hypothetical protein K438DRAFT_1998194 [Mycena galopus ATCC 62051]|nr:hypothetical protein K438DRAFT_1998194 [Mycena galopus ATCC 62051]
MWRRPNSTVARTVQFKLWILALVLIIAFACIWVLGSLWWETDRNHHRWAPSLEDVVIGEPSLTAGEPEASMGEAGETMSKPPAWKAKPAAAVMDSGKNSSGEMGKLLRTEGPSAAFRDNLRADVQYITSWPANGWSNQVIEFINLIYLGELTQRIVIIPRFRPVHLDGLHAAHIDFSDVFDLPRLRRWVTTPILEWREVKDVESTTVEDMGCWDVQYMDWASKGSRLYLEPPVDLKLDLSYTRAPKYVSTSLEMDKPKDEVSVFLWPLASLAFYTPRLLSMEHLPTPLPSPLHKVSMPPDEHLFCVNSLYFGVGLLEVAEDLCPAWEAVGRHIHFTPEVQRIAAAYTRRTLGVEDAEEIPPYIAVHVRRGDFSIWCKVAVQNCFAPFAAYERRVNEVRAQIIKNTGVDVSRVIITSDETSSAWWTPILERGWVRPDHSKTVEEYGPWHRRYPIIIDAAIQGAAAGFVGTDTSTVSILARRRVATRGGVAEMVKWGQPNADDHKREFDGQESL